MGDKTLNYLGLIDGSGKVMIIYNKLKKKLDLNGCLKNNHILRNSMIITFFSIIVSCLQVLVSIESISSLINKILILSLVPFDLVSSRRTLIR